MISSIDQKIVRVIVVIGCCILVLNGTAQDTARRLPSWALGGFLRPQFVNPVIRPNEQSFFNDPMTGKKAAWEAYYTFNPAAVVKGDSIVVLYRAEDKTGTVIGTRTSRIGYAQSHDGIQFQRNINPVFYPNKDNQRKYEWPGGCEDPRVAVTEDGRYVMLYTQWNRKTPRLGVATSSDLVTWRKHGPAFLKAYRGRFANVPHKSASLLTTVKNGRLVITKIRGKYWMYWGELHVYGATSEDLVHWTPLVDEKRNLIELMAPRKGSFDSHLVECGPPAVLTEKGIVLLYNGKNRDDKDRDTLTAANTYAGGQALFDKDDPTKLITQLDTPFFRPMESFEKSGQYAAGTVFMEGLVYFKKKWYLYYGCADSFVGVAVFNPAEPSTPDPWP